MSDLGTVLVGVVLGLAIVGAVLLRNEEKVREAWRQRRGDSEPKAGDASRWIIVSMGFIASINIGLGIVSGDVFHIVLGTLWLLMLYLSLRKYRRSRSKQGAALVP